MGKGLFSSFAGTGINAIDVGTLGLAHGYTNDLRDQWGNLLAGSGPDTTYRPQSLMEQYNQQGILGPAVQNIGNVAAGAGVASKIAGLGELGTVAEATAAASRVADAGFTAEDVARATEAAKAGASGLREAGVTSDVLRTAAKTAIKADGLGESLDPAAVASRVRAAQRPARRCTPISVILLRGPTAAGVSRYRPADWWRPGHHRCRSTSKGGCQHRCAGRCNVGSSAGCCGRTGGQDSRQRGDSGQGVRGHQGR